VKRLLPALLLCLLPVAVVAESLDVVVADPFLELRTGAGRGYPVTHVVRRGETLVVLKRRTDWFKVRDVRGREGWVHREQLAMTLVPDVGPIDARPPGTDRSGRYSREAGVMAGAFEDDHVLTAYGSYAFNPHLAVELRISQVFSYDFDAQLLALGLTHSFAPDWRVQPFLSIGTGLIRVRPEQPPGPTTTDQHAYFGAGIRVPLSPRIAFRAEFNEYVVFTERDDNEEITEWKLGFAFSF
jgi:DNA-binding transcriptional LysR family regulator